MSILYERHINTDQNCRVEFLMIHFDYVDGNDFLARYFKEDYNMVADVKPDGVFYSIIKLHLENTEYNLVWHEDVGNYLYSTQQDKIELEILENRLKSIIRKINKRLTS